MHTQCMLNAHTVYAQCMLLCSLPAHSVDAPAYSCTLRARSVHVPYTFCAHPVLPPYHAQSYSVCIAREAAGLEHDEVYNNARFVSLNIY